MIIFLLIFPKNSVKRYELSKVSSYFARIQGK